MRVTIHQSMKETAETFLLDPEGLPWHLCRYPERPGIWRCRPGTACETPCEAIALSTPAPVVVVQDEATGEPEAPAEAAADAVTPPTEEAPPEEASELAADPAEEPGDQ